MLWLTPETGSYDTAGMPYNGRKNASLSRLDLLQQSDFLGWLLKRPAGARAERHDLRSNPDFEPPLQPLRDQIVDAVEMRLTE